MRKPHKIKLILPKPCSEDWDKMTPDEQGRFCANCNKAVIDFSKFTDTELFNFFVKTKEHVCGRFNSLQLNRTIAIYEPADTSILKRIFFGAALTAGVAGTAHGQNATPNQTHQVQTPNDTTKKGSNQTTQKKHTSNKHPAKPVDPPPLMGAPMRIVDEKESHDTARPVNPDKTIYK
jgi:hypothetical protein